MMNVLLAASVSSPNASLAVVQMPTALLTWPAFTTGARTPANEAVSVDGTPTALLSITGNFALVSLAIQETPTLPVTKFLMASVGRTKSVAMAKYVFHQDVLLDAAATTTVPLTRLASMLSAMTPAALVGSVVSTPSVELSTMKPHVLVCPVILATLLIAVA